MRFVGDLQPTFQGHPTDKNWGILQHEICGRFTTNFLGGSQGTKIEEFYSFRFGAGYREAFRGISERKMIENTISNLHQVYHKAFVKESKMFEVNFNRICTYKFSQTFHKEKLEKFYNSNIGEANPSLKPKVFVTQPSQHVVYDERCASSAGAAEPCTQ